MTSNLTTEENKGRYRAESLLRARAWYLERQKSRAQTSIKVSARIERKVVSKVKPSRKQYLKSPKAVASPVRSSARIRAQQRKSIATPSGDIHKPKALFRNTTDRKSRISTQKTSGSEEKLTNTLNNVASSRKTRRSMGGRPTSQNPGIDSFTRLATQGTVASENKTKERVTSKITSKLPTFNRRASLSTVTSEPSVTVKPRRQSMSKLDDDARHVTTRKSTRLATVASQKASTDKTTRRFIDSACKSSAIATSTRLSMQHTVASKQAARERLDRSKATATKSDVKISTAVSRLTRRATERVVASKKETQDKSVEKLVATTKSIQSTEDIIVPELTMANSIDSTDTEVAPKDRVAETLENHVCSEMEKSRDGARIIALSATTANEMRSAKEGGCAGARGTFTRALVVMSMVGVLVLSFRWAFPSVSSSPAKVDSDISVFNSPFLPAQLEEPFCNLDENAPGHCQ